MILAPIIFFATSIVIFATVSYFFSVHVRDVIADRKKDRVTE